MSNLASARTIYLFIVLLLPSLMQFVAATGSDVAKERRWAEQVADGLLDGDPVWLDDGDGHDFLGIFTQGDSDSGRAVILLHGIGAHPNWPDVIYPLRQGLLEQSLTTLSLQMPILDNDAEQQLYVPLFAEVPSRLDAAIEYLIASGYSKFTIIGHSAGSTMAAYYLSRDYRREIDAFVAIGMGPGISSSAINNYTALENITVPILDLYGSDDLEQVLDTAELRAAAANKRPGRSYLQVRVDGANHFFQGNETELVKQVVEWLDTQSK